MRFQFCIPMTMLCLTLESPFHFRVEMWPRVKFEQF
jgi:hypothetical protein